MLPNIRPKALGLTGIPKKVPGRFIKSKHHRDYVCTELPTLRKTMEDIVKKLNETNPESGWNVAENVHGPHESHVVEGEKIHFKPESFREHNVEMEFTVTGCGFRFSEPKSLVLFILTGRCTRKQGGEGVPPMRKRWGLPDSKTFEEHVLVALGSMDSGSCDILGRLLQKLEKRRETAETSLASSYMLLRILTKRSTTRTTFDTSRNLLVLKTGEISLELAVVGKKITLTTPHGSRKVKARLLAEIKNQLQKIGAPPEAIWLAVEEVLLHLHGNLAKVAKISDRAAKNFVIC